MATKGMRGLAVLVMAVFAGAGAAEGLAAEKAALPAVVYGTKAADPALWVPSGYMGDTGAIKIDDKCAETPKDGAECMKVTFDKADGWGGVVWQSPANDWGQQAGGWDLTGAKKLSFWARGAKGGEKVKFEAGILGKDAKFPDSGKIVVGEFVLTAEWKQYQVDLAGKDLTCIKTGFMWVVGGQGAPITFFLDEIVYE